jgi:hypothetical protein
MNDSTPNSASSIRLPPLASSAAMATTNWKIPATINWMPNRTATTSTVRSGQIRTTTPSSSVMMP